MKTLKLMMHKKKFFSSDPRIVKALLLVMIALYFRAIWSIENRALLADHLLAGFAALFATGLTYFVLRVISFFDSLRIVPRKSDFLLLLFALSFSGLSTEIIHSVIFGFKKASLLKVLLTLPVAASFIFISYTVLARSISKERKRKVALRLSDEDREKFIQTLNEAGLSEEVDVLTPASVLNAFAKGRQPQVDMIVFSRRTSQDMQEDRFLLRAHLAGIPIVDLRNIVASLSRKINVDDIDVWNFIQSATPQTTLLRVGRLIQEVLEPIVALLMIVALIPLFAVVALAIKLTSPGPVFYAQRRTGYLGKVFTLYKFRSMRSDSEAKGYQWAKKSDPRVTGIGKFIRKTRIDELPQLFNVLRGDMCFVGPRPERPEIYADLKRNIPLFSLRTDVRPGITGWAQVCAGYAASIEESKLKLEHDLYYIQNISLRLDLVIILMTLKVIIFGNEFIQSVPAAAQTSENPLAESSRTIS